MFFKIPAKIRRAVVIGALMCKYGSQNLSAEPLPEKFLKERPKLVVVLVIDQFRADYLTRFLPRFLPASKGTELGGFSYLLKSGAFFPQGQFDILQSMTGPGHATILSGSYPYQAGIPLNNWFDAKTQKPMYCAEDADVSTLGAKGKAGSGTSPRNLLASTVGDELKNAGFASRVVSVALKDRAAIFMGGHRADISLWMDAEAYRWVSSKFYFPGGQLPAWVDQLNRDLDSKKTKPYTWKTTPGSGAITFQSTVPTLIPKELKQDIGTGFPHAVDASKVTALQTPFGLEATETAAEQAVRAYKLGKNSATDLLAVSFSSHDYAGHAYGPNSRELEEMTIQDDRTLARFFNFLRREVPGGMKNIVLVLTADHGIPPDPDWLQTERVAAGRLDEKKMAADLETYLTDKFGSPKGDKWLSYVRDMNFYLSVKPFSDKDLVKSEIERAIKIWLSRVEGIAKVVTASEYSERKLPPGQFERQFLKTYVPGRSGDVVAIVSPNYMSGQDTVMHMTGYKYDSTVPIVFAGAHIKPGVFATAAEVVDIAPTLSFLMGCLPPNLSEGRVLSEILK